MHIYSVPVIPPNLRHEETIIQAANAFEYISCVIDEVFTKINTRITSNNNRVDDLNKRIQIANRKVDTLMGTKAVTIFSASKYPASEVYQAIPATFDFSEHKSTLSLATEYDVKSKHDQLINKNVKEKLQFFHVNVTGKQREKKLRQSLEPAPEYLNSVNAFLLFNTKENCYERKVEVPTHSQDAKNSKFKVNEVAKSSEKRIDDAPSSIVNRKTSRKYMDELFYSPKLNDAPQIDVPLDLPDLPGVADNIIFMSDEDFHLLKPSSVTDSISRKLISPTEIVKGMTGNKESLTLKNTPILQLDNNIDKNRPVSIPSAAALTVPPPPPPPPPMPMIQTTTSDSPDHSVVLKVGVDPPKDLGNAHMNLMAAIRATGGKERAKLRAAESSKSEEIPKVKPGGDLMADLHNKLLMRRKGISGAKENNPGSNSGGTMIEKLSALIPAISKQNDDSSSESADEDWE